MSLSDFVGIPYQGDRFCRVLVARVLAEQGIPFPEVERPQDATEWKRVVHPRRYDVVVFNRGGRPGHVGVCLGNGQFLHVEEGERSGADDLASALWASRIEGYYRYVGAREALS